MGEGYLVESERQAVDAAHSAAEERYGHRGFLCKWKSEDIKNNQRRVEVRLRVGEAIHRFSVFVQKDGNLWLAKEVKEEGKEDKMLEVLKVLEERKELGKRQEELKRISEALFRNAILLLNQKGTLATEKMWMCFESEGGGSREVPVPFVQYRGEINEDGVSVPVFLYTRRASKEELAAYLEGDLYQKLDSRTDMDLIIEIGDEKEAIWFDCCFGKLCWMSILGVPAYTIVPGWVALPWTRINFIKELNAWTERQMGS